VGLRAVTTLEAIPGTFGAVKGEAMLRESVLTKAD